MVDRILSARVAEYSMGSVKNPDGTTKMTVTFANLSMIETYEDVTLYLRRRADDVSLKFNHFEALPKPPFFIASAASPTSNADSVVITISKWPPGGEFQLTGSISGEGTPFVQFSAESAGVLLTERNVQTFLVRHEFGILVGLVIVGMAACIGILVWTTSQPGDGSARGEDVSDEIGVT